MKSACDPQRSARTGCNPDAQPSRDLRRRGSDSGQAGRLRPACHMRCTAVAHALRAASCERGSSQAARLVKLPGALHHRELVQVRLILAAMSASVITSEGVCAGANSATSAVRRLEAGAAHRTRGSSSAVRRACSSSSTSKFWKSAMPPGRAAAALDARYAPGKAAPSGCSGGVPAISHGRDARALAPRSSPARWRARATLKCSTRRVVATRRRSRSRRRPQGLAQ